MAVEWPVRPGEVDHEMDFAQLYHLPLLEADAETERACEAIYRRYVRDGAGDLVPPSAFCDVPRTAFFDFAGRHGVLMAADHGKGLAPVVVSRSLVGWDRPRHVAFRRGVEAMLAAILNRSRLAGSGQSVVTWPFADPARPSEAYYVGLDYRALTSAPWRRGVVGLYRASDFPDDLWTRPFLASRPILPLARVVVDPSDWPLLARVEGVDHAAQGARMRESFRGFPWRDDDVIHPGRWRQAPAARMRRHLDAHLDEPADLARLSRLIGATPPTALRTFRAVYGQSPREYALRARVARAKALLRAGRAIGEAALETGFCDQSHLTGHFRRIVGLTPGAYVRTQEYPIL